jgi:hypothetical protein
MAIGRSETDDPDMQSAISRISAGKSVHIPPMKSNTSHHQTLIKSKRILSV